MKKIAFFDLDKTLYDGFSMVEFLFGYSIPQGLIKKEDQETAQKLISDYSQGVISYGQATAEAVRLSGTVMAGHTIEEVSKWQGEFFQTKKLFPYVLELFSFLKKEKFEIYIVSASVEPIVTHIASQLGVRSFASTIESIDGVYTGVVTRVLDAEAKSEALHQLLDGEQFSLGFGDSSGDTALLNAVTHGFLYEPSAEVLKELAQTHGWTLVTRDTILEEVRSILVTFQLSK